MGLVPQHRSVTGTTGAEEGLGKLFDDGRLVPLATEDVEIGAVGVIGEVPADQGRLDQLHHAVAGDPAFSEIDDLAGAISLHFDQLAELHNVGFDLFGIANAFGNAVVEVNGGANAPGFAGSDGVRMDCGVSNVRRSANLQTRPKATGWRLRLASRRRVTW